MALMPCVHTQVKRNSMMCIDTQAAVTSSDGDYYVSYDR